MLIELTLSADDRGRLLDLAKARRQSVNGLVARLVREAIHPRGSPRAIASWAPGQRVRFETVAR